MPGTNLTRAEAQARAAIVSTETYDIDLDLSTLEDTFRSVTTVRFSATAGQSTFIDLIAPTVHSITLNGEELDPATHFADSRIQLPHLQAANELTVVADCAYMNTGEGLHRFVDPETDEIYLYSQFEVADSRRVFPVFEQPDLKAAFTFTVTAPDHWHVVSNNPGSKSAVDGRHVTIAGKQRGVARWQFTETPRIPCYITAIVAGPYHRVEGTVRSRKGTIQADVYCRTALAEYLDADVILADTQAGFDYYEDKFEIDYPFEKYDQLFVPEFNAGAMENAGCVTFLEDYVFRSKPPQALVERRTVTILHELAHMWFGDLVTMKWWNDLWLNESFAEYASTMATVNATRWKNNWVTFNASEKTWAARQDQLPSTHPIMADINDLEDVEVNFDGITYAKGASVLRQLAAWVGEDEFFAGVAEYLRKHSWSNATLRDLLVELEKTSGRDLKRWSELWLEKAGITTLRPEIEVDDHLNIVSFAVLQEVPEEWPTYRPHRLGIGGYDVVVSDTGDARLERTMYVETDIDGPRTEVPEVLGKLRPALLLINDGDLAYTKVRVDPQSLATAVDHLSDFADPLARSLVLSAAWDMTRDGELPAHQFIELVLGCIGSETESTTVLILLRQLKKTLALYVHPDYAQQATEQTAEALWKLALEAEPGTDSQLQFVRAFASLATSEAHLDNLQGLLDDKLHLEGLEVDKDLAWDLLTGLVTAGRADEYAIELQLTKDPTASGHRRAAHARAALANPEAKRRAWDSLVNAEQDMPNALLFAATAGFTDVMDTALLEPFVDDYFAAVRRLYTDKTSEMAATLIEGLYPVKLAGRVPDLQDKADAWLADNADAHPALRRLIIEGRDGVRRALETQAKDA